MPFTIDLARLIFPNTKVADAVPATVESFNQLKAEDQLALLWFVYTEMEIPSLLRLCQQPTWFLQKQP